MKNSKIESLERKPNSDFQSKYKENQTVYAFHIKFENGDEGQINAHSETPSYRVGDNIDYTIKETQFGFRVKKENANYFNNSSNNNSGGSFKKDDIQDSIIKQSCLKCATIFHQGSTLTPDEVIDTAEIFASWVKGEKKEQPF